MSDCFKANFMLKIESVRTMDYFSGKTIYTNNFKEILDEIKKYYEKENERIYKLTIVFNSYEDYNVKTVTLISNYKLVPENFLYKEKYDKEYKELLMIEKLKRR